MKMVDKRKRRARIVRRYLRIKRREAAADTQGDAVPVADDGRGDEIDQAIEFIGG